MGWTKEQLVLQAFEEAGYASYTYDLQPEQIQTGLRRLDAMMANWNGKGIRLGYPLPASPGSSSLSDDAGVPDSAYEAIYTNLAIRIGPPVGKTISAETKMTARDSYKTLLMKVAMPKEMQFPSTMPSGAGQKRTDWPFLDGPEDTVDAGNDSAIDFD